ncbi:MAG: hypothetical protein ACJAQV_001728 [Loktanella salsilacus]|jgi:hypothetical protein
MQMIQNMLFPLGFAPYLSGHGPCENPA